ncbi:MAG: hypothetical protein K6E29_02155 [Cyanobacteria bacterium RUI128]|nr:hypothetical protein [Cyanobacteria bacterium RUI128]
MNSVSFGSTYKINNNNYPQHTGPIMDFCDKNDLEYCSKTEVSEIKKHSIPKYKASTTIIAPDSKDSLVETFLANKGIKFNKLDTKELLNKSKIQARVESAPKDMKLVTVDAKKLEELIYNQDTNIGYCENTYKNYYKDGVNLMIRSGDKLPATTLYITPTGESTDDAVNYIKRFGKDRLNEDQLSFMFTQRTDDPDQCMYFGMKDLGMDKVPMYVNKDTYKIADALGLLK